MIELKNVYKEFGENSSKSIVLRGINIEISEGEAVAIMGPSGSGKTTLLNIIGCLDVPNSGSYYLKGENVVEKNSLELAGLRNSTFGFIVQDFALINEYNVIENIMLPTLYSKKGSKDSRIIAHSILKRLKIEDKIYSYPSKLSGGEKQRVAIARALINNPEILLADEPTGSLDQETGQTVLDLLLEIHKNLKKTIILVTHDSNIATKCERIVKIVDGVISYR